MKSHAIVMILVLALLAFCQTAGAVITPESTEGTAPPPYRPMPNGVLDDGCIIDYQSMPYGGNAGDVHYYPSGSYGGHIGLMEFTNSCTPGELLQALCIDLNHELSYDPYCAELNDAVVNPLYPEQYKAMGYVLSWNAINSDLEARILQTAVWKLSSVWDMFDPNFGVPYYHINNGVGYPFGDPPAYPYVNTVYHSYQSVNNPANLMVIDALGYAEDGLEKNIMIEGDQCLFATDPPDIRPDIDSSFVRVQLCIERGARALAAGNTSVSGIKLLVSTDNGLFSNEVMFTDEDGCIEFVIGQKLNALVGVEVTACTYSQWPVLITPCDDDEGGEEERCFNPQRLIVFGDPDTLCCSLPIPPDQWLSAELTSFDAVVEHGQVVLNWSTASENQLSYWEIERRETGHGAFEMLAIVEGHNSVTGSQYRYVDENIVNGRMYDYRLADVDLNGLRTVHDMIRTAGVSESGGVPTEFALYNAYPNPFNPEAVIRYTIGESGPVTLKVFDITGAEVATLADGYRDVGVYSESFNGAALPSGTYFYRLTAEGFTATKKMILLK